MFFLKKIFFGKKKFFPEISFTKYYEIWDPHRNMKQTAAIIASEMSFRSGWVLTKSSNSTICQKYGKNTVFEPS